MVCFLFCSKWYTNVTDDILFYYFENYEQLIIVSVFIFTLKRHILVWTPLRMH